MALKPRYVFGEAWSVARSGPRQTAMAIALIALSLYVPGLLALLSRNLARVVTSAGESPAVVVTLEAAADARAIAGRVATDGRVARIVIVGSDAALERFRRTYPDLAAALAHLKEAPFPPTLEVFLRKQAPARAGAEIAAAARSWPGVEAADSEEGFDRRFRDGVRLLRAAALFLGVVLTLAAILSVGSAIRLALDLHSDEIEIMRLMGATETAVRAPFWLYASAEGLIGGALALLMLWGTWQLGDRFLARHPHPVMGLLWARFLDWHLALLVPVIGLVAGFLGSLLSLGKKSAK
jgi:cell division transport system permease protein